MMNNSNMFGNKIWITAVVLCVGVLVSQFGVLAAPQNNENNETPFPLELQPPLIDNLQDAIDSYGNPITYSQPIETPDGRKVISAQGVQFEIPNYASGITEIKKPIENLLPPFVGESSSEYSIESTTKLPTTLTITTTIDDSTQSETAHQFDFEKNSDEKIIGDLALDPSSADYLTQTQSIYQDYLDIDNNKNNNSSNSHDYPVSQINTTPFAVETNINISNFPLDQSSIFNNSHSQTLDPNAAAQQNAAFYSAQGEYTLPDWLADFNDPDVGPGVPYTPSNDGNSLKVLSWDLVPPNENDPQAVAPNFGKNQQNTFPVRFSTNQGFGTNHGIQTTTSQPRTTIRTTQRPTTTTRRTTARTTTTTTTTTTTPPPPTTTTTEITNRFSNSISTEIFVLPGGNSQVLPSWLEGFDDPELSVAVPFEVPEDNKEYNHTLLSSLLPPLEPFEDLKTLSISGFPPSRVLPIAQTNNNNVAAIPSTTPISIRTTTSKPPSTTTVKPFQFQLTTKKTTNPPVTFTQKPVFNFSPKTTNTPINTFTAVTETPISNRIPQLTLKSSSRATGFTPTSYVATQPTVKPTVQSFFDSKFNPFFNSRNGQNGFSSFQRVTPTTTAAPTTTNFHLSMTTTPSWLQGRINPGPGVPFSLPKQQQAFSGVGIVQTTNPVAEQTIDGVTIQTSISSELPPLNFIHNSIPSQSIIPTNQAFIFTSTPIPEPSKLFTPPVVLPDKDENSNIDGNLQYQTTPINSNNFPEAFEQTTKPSTKVTFTKNDQGKVISNSVFEPVQLSTKPGFANSQSTSIASTSPTFAPGFSLQPSTTEAAGKYTGGFGGAPGFLGGQNRPGYAVQADGSIKDPDHTVRPGQVAAPTINLQSRFEVPKLQNSSPTPALPLGPKRTYTGSFGGPPGVLVPFDNGSQG